ncbi:hypothetical protein PF005_g2006 [Phytophthora fragariae]|uniref:Magnesium transporter n=1 Tax=Phytophthora fragariae TaxID=53985 RepID=A0A6A3TIY2_9STRA|nr:hypothetical protein PF007_g1750 [Phytophthora fragariae]KAE9234182.1 hypothetical protein PF005_g2006 [Phytophthora fragariae]KAE9253003.1 hypothetical protein PF004_g1708 [Phytophthora fragariae]KAE9256111.1 hypothetical protein PF002_g2039 [Phytophthora fragariae]
MANNNLGEGSAEPSEVSGANSPRHFFCRFDPVTKKDKLLMLLFDSKCNSTLNEMSRLDVLRVTQDAARFQRETERSPLFDPLRAIVLRDLCLVYVPDGADSLLSMLKHDFASNACDGAGSPFEFRALEALLTTLARYFRAQYDQIYPVIAAELEHLVRGNVDLRELERLREFKNTMNEFEAQVEGVRRVLMDLLDNEEDLRLLYLTKLYQDPSLLGNLFSFDSEEAEVLIENYLQDIFSTRTTAELLQHRISNTESLVTLKLDSKRNYLLAVQLVFSLVLINIAVGTLVTGIFGMNLFSGVENAAHWFWAVGIAIVIFFALATGSGIVHFTKKGVMLT